MSTTTTYPLILFNIDNQIVTRRLVSKQSSFFIRGNHKFDVRILNNKLDDVGKSDIKLYSAIPNPTPVDAEDLFIIDSDYDVLYDKSAFTLFCKTTQYVNIEVRSLADNVKYRYEIYFSLIDESVNLLYNDLLTNYKLPTKDILQPAIVNSDTATAIKRLLLDYKEILRYKGTDVGIAKFLYLIGFDVQQITVITEWLTPSGNITLEPDTTVDIKTGNYHVLYDNWIYDDEFYTPKNLPKRLLNVFDINDLLDKLYYAVSIANIYFTSVEQDIVFFGLGNSSNSEQFLSITSNTSKIYENNIYWYSDALLINLFSWSNMGDDEIDKNFVVKRCIQQTKKISKKTKKYVKSTPIINKDIYPIDYEIFDDTDLSGIPIETQFHSFSCLLHLDIDLSKIWNIDIDKQFYYKYKIYNKDIPMINITSNLLLLDSGGYVVDIPFVINRDGTYIVMVEIFDEHNNREYYHYEFNMSPAFTEISFETFNSLILIEDNKFGVTVESAYPTTSKPLDYFYELPYSFIPALLSEYFDSIPSLTFQYIIDNGRYIVDEINNYFDINESTDTIPLKFTSNWLHIIGLQDNIDYDLMLRYEDNMFNVQYGNPFDITPDMTLHNRNIGFIRKLDVWLADTDITPTPYFFISTLSGGIKLNKSTFDLVLIEKANPDNVISIYDIVDDDVLSMLDMTDEVFIPINHDFTLVRHQYDFDTDSYDEVPVLIESLFNRLININMDITNTYQMKIGDIFVCRPDNDYILNANDITWFVYDSLSGEQLFTTKEYALKYRIDDYIVYDIKLVFKVDTATYEIRQNSVVSSFIV